MIDQREASKLTIIRLSLSGALIGTAIMGMLGNWQYHKEFGAVIGGLAVLVAKVKNLI